MGQCPACGELLHTKVVLVLVIVRDERTYTRRLDALERRCIHFLMATAAVLSVVSRHPLTMPPTRPEHFGWACSTRDLQAERLELVS
jgi:hypothetical protein